MLHRAFASGPHHISGCRNACEVGRLLVGPVGVGTGRGGTGLDVLDSLDTFLAILVALGHGEVIARLHLLGMVRVDRKAVRGTGERREHLAHIGQLRVDAVAALRGRGELAVGLCADAVGGRPGLAGQDGGALLGLLDDRRASLSASPRSR